jgi:hypothetical protein
MRTVQNWIGGNDYNPYGADFVLPPPEFVTGALDDLVAFLNLEAFPLLVRAAVARAQFETVHPLKTATAVLAARLSTWCCAAEAWRRDTFHP